MGPCKIFCFPFHKSISDLIFPTKNIILLPGIQIRHGPARNPERAGPREPGHNQEPKQEPRSRRQPVVQEY